MNRSTLITAVALATLCLGSTHRFTAAQDAGNGEVAQNGQAFVKLLTENLFTKDAKVRYSLSKALETMGNQAVPHLNKLKTATKNKHHRAFVDRIIKRIRPSKKLSGDERERRRFMSMMGWSRDLSIDRLAMEVGLDFEQMSNVEPIMKRTEKNLSELWDEFQKANAWRDRDAWSVLRDEQKAAVDESMADLRKHVGGKQAIKLKKLIDRYVNPWGNRGRGGRGGRDRGRGGRGERRRP